MFLVKENQSKAQLRVCKPLKSRKCLQNEPLHTVTPHTASPDAVGQLYNAPMSHVDCLSIKLGKTPKTKTRKELCYYSERQ